MACEHRAAASTPDPDLTGLQLTMSTILVFCVIASAAWLVMSLISRSSSSGPKDSVEDFSRALSALSPQDPAARRPARPVAGAAPQRGTSQGGGPPRRRPAGRTARSGAARTRRAPRAVHR
jgi:hypothetical protein